MYEKQLIYPWTWVHYIYVFIMHVFLYEEKWVVDENVYTNMLALTSYQKYFHKETNYPCLNILFIFAKGPLAKHV